MYLGALGKAGARAGCAEAPMTCKSAKGERRENNANVNK